MDFLDLDYLIGYDENEHFKREERQYFAENFIIDNIMNYNHRVWRLKLYYNNK